ncbi:MAG TPA: LLM class flavin-dependent oxidoreductase, partial [Miltoncostaeaceae bacterium]|nr:LLM class flavin-dependent oxidoreductase [Miltoncostaeaceae bacterium]
ALTLDHLTGGRFILGVGTGEAINLTPFGLRNERPLGRVAEGLHIMRSLFADDRPFSFRGDHFTLTDATLGLRPLG